MTLVKDLAKNVKSFRRYKYNKIFFSLVNWSYNSFLHLFINSESYIRLYRIFNKRYLLNTSSRTTLELVILPYLHQIKGIKKVLLIGIDIYCEHYSYYLKRKETVVYTLDYNPKVRVFGSSHHIIDNVINLNKHFTDNSLDLIMLTGVYGWGLNSKENLIETLGKINNILRSGGILIFGYNKTPSLDPLDLDNNLEYFSNFTPFVIQGSSEISINDSTFAVFYFFRNI